MDQLDELLDKLEELTDRLFISGIGSVTLGTVVGLKEMKSLFEDAGLQYGSGLITDMIWQIEQSKMSFREQNGICDAFIRLQSFVDAARSIRQTGALCHYYGVDRQ